MPDLQSSPSGPALLTADFAKSLADAIRYELTAQAAAAAAMGDDIVADEQTAATLINVSRRTLQAWRTAGKGPRTVKLGVRAVGYRLGELRRWVRAQEERRHTP